MRPRDLVFALMNCFASVYFDLVIREFDYEMRSIFFSMDSEAQIRFVCMEMMFIFYSNMRFLYGK